jgi:hypothetical protein
MCYYSQYWRWCHSEGPERTPTDHSLGGLLQTVNMYVFVQNVHWRLFRTQLLLRAVAFLVNMKMI